MSFRLRILTQEGLVTEAQVQSVTLQGIDGQIGILQGHTDYIGVLGNGPLTFLPATSTGGSGAAQKYNTIGGFCQVKDGDVEVLADAIA